MPNQTEQLPPKPAQNPPLESHLHAHAINILAGDFCGVSMLQRQLREMQLEPSRFPPSVTRPIADKIAALHSAIRVLYNHKSNPENTPANPDQP